MYIYIKRYNNFNLEHADGSLINEKFVINAIINQKHDSSNIKNQLILVLY